MPAITKERTYIDKNTDGDDAYSTDGEASDTQPMPTPKPKAMAVARRPSSSSSPTQRITRKTTKSSSKGTEGGADIEHTETVTTGSKKDDNGLKLRLELNLDIELELKAKIHGDLTLALLS
ncbi:hypothetical protein BJY01DRAFT_207271 [Aspergillus pseudoustus]|uniref:Uncharacterized protein n=1 Tax=Aspergillus pseudoustus TaxID=1810923 RepID=A0ABR4KMM3_9EURO